MSLGAGLRLATGLLTVVPVRSLDDVLELPATDPAAARRTGGAAMLLAPVAVLPLAAAAALVVAAGDLLGLPPLVVAALVPAVLALGTRAMHLDALADTADGIGAGWDRERALEVMHRGDVGPMGAATLVLVLLLQVAALTSLVTLPWAPLLVAAVVVVSRGGCTLACLRGVPPARQSGMGSLVAGAVPVPLAGIALLAWSALLAGAGALAGLAWWQGPVAVLAAAVAVAALLRTCQRVFGGVTGDVIGATIEVMLLTLLLTLTVGTS